MISKVQLLQLSPWQRNFYLGRRLLGEVQLLGSAFVGDLPPQQLLEGCQQQAPQSQLRMKLTYDDKLGTSNIEGTFTGLSGFDSIHQDDAEYQPGQESARDPRIRSHPSQRLGRDNTKLDYIAAHSKARQLESHQLGGDTNPDQIKSWERKDD